MADSALTAQMFRTQRYEFNVKHGGDSFKLVLVQLKMIRRQSSLFISPINYLSKRFLADK